MAAATRVPVHLRGPTRAWIRRVLDDYVLSETEFRVLILAGEAWDRGAEAREQVARDGAYIRDRYGSTKPHPALAVQRDARRDFAKLVAQLSLTQDDVAVACGGEVVGVPQRPRTNADGHAAPAARRSVVATEGRASRRRPDAPGIARWEALTFATATQACAAVAVRRRG